MICMKERTRDFYFFTLFGVPYHVAEKLTEEEKIEICARRAYGDLSRTIHYCKSSEWLEKHEKEEENFINAKEDFKKIIQEDIVESILQLLSQNAESAEVFNKWHAGCCTKIKENANRRTGVIKEKSFSYGQAQKWVNMTLKYMDISGFWDQDIRFTGLRGMLHVPVDSYIMEAAKEADVSLPRKNVKGKSSEIKAWSKWEDTDYDNFITKLTSVIEGQGKSLSDWEDEAWIAGAWKKSDRNN